MTATIVDQRGGLKVARQTFAVSSATQREAIDVTPQVRGALHPYKHNDAHLSDCEGGNATVHLRATLLAHGVAVAVADGELLLAGAQRIFLAEWDGPRPRQMHIQVMGVQRDDVTS